MSKQRIKSSATAVRYYEEHAEELSARYMSVSFEQVHADLLPLLPLPGKRVLDVGAGSGRDAIALARRGCIVTAVEPSTQLRNIAREHAGAVHIRWLDDSLPALGSVVASGEKYEFILLSAVWMHVAPHDRGKAMRVLASLLEPGAKLAVTIRVGGDGGRSFFPASRAGFVATARRFGLSPKGDFRKERDALGREDVWWDKVVLTAPSPTKL